MFGYEEHMERQLSPFQKPHVDIRQLMTAEELEGRLGGRITKERIDAWSEAEIIPHFELEGERLYLWDETRIAINNNLLVRREANPVRVLSVKHALPGELPPPPDAISRFAQHLVRIHVSSIGEAKWTGIYFLCLEGVVVYVGQTKNRLSYRVPQHCSSKVFDSAFCVRLDPLDLDYVETELIRELKPIYNTHGEAEELKFPRAYSKPTEAGVQLLDSGLNHNDSRDDLASHRA